MKKYRLKKYISLLMIICLTMTSIKLIGTGTVLGDTESDIQDAKNVQSQLQEKIDSVEGEIQELKAKSADTESYINELDNKMSTINNTLSNLNTQISDKQTQIENTRTELEKAQIDSDSQYESMKLRIQFMYEHSSEDYLTILLASTSLADFLNKANYITNISQYDREKLTELKLTVDLISEKKEQIESEYNELSEMQTSLTEQKNAMVVVQSAKVRELQNLDSLTQQAEGSKADLEEQKVAQENKILDLVTKKNNEDIARKIEEERLKKEKEEQQKAEEERRKQQEIQAANSNSSTESSSTSSSSSSNSSSSSSTSSSSSSSSSASSEKSDGFIWPTPSHRITCYFGDPEDRAIPHRGLDIGAVSRGVAGDPIYAAADGVVTIAETGNPSYGNYVALDHGNGYQTLYAHAVSLNVSEGQYVSQGDVIAYMGTTGNSTGVHLHFAIIHNGDYTDPLSYY